MQPTITDSDIRALRREAATASDLEQVRLCDLALTLPDLRAFGRPIEERLAEAYAARDACEAAIRAAEAMED